MKKQIGAKKNESPAQLIDARIEELCDWRATMLSRIRGLFAVSHADGVRAENKA